MIDTLYVQSLWTALAPMCGIKKKTHDESDSDNESLWLKVGAEEFFKFWQVQMKWRLHAAPQGQKWQTISRAWTKATVKHNHRWFLLADSPNTHLHDGVAF